MSPTIDMSRYTVVPISMKKIYLDHEFNCRGRIAKSECMDLARDIKDNGLDFPIHVHPYQHPTNPEIEYRVVSGHCRYTAFEINGEDTIPAVVRADLKTEEDIRGANLRENVQRRDLNVVQEADAIQWYVERGYNSNQIAGITGKSPGWVEIRRKVKQLPEVVQVAAREGSIKQSHINQLWENRGDPEKMMQMLVIIKERVQMGMKAVVIKEDIKITDLVAVRRPKPHEVESFMEVVASCITNKLDQPEYFAHRTLAWAAGNISLLQLYISLREECKRLGLAFSPPLDVKKILDGATKV